MIQTLVDKVKCLCQGRSSKWPAVRKAYLVSEPACKVCGTKKKCEVHHVLPFHVWPSLELDPTNFITLCRDHHLLFGHLTEWASINKECRSDCEVWAAKIKARP